MSTFWVVEVNDSDGNNNDISDMVVEAVDAGTALDAAADAVEARAKERKIDMESDGRFGWFYGCDCEIPAGEEDSWECAHGGVLLNETPEGPFETQEAAEAACAPYHSRF